MALKALMIKDSPHVKPQALTLKVTGWSLSKYTDYLNFPQFLQENGHDIVSNL
jgi:hypothetical protein